MLRMQLLEQPGDEARSLGAWTDLQQHCTTDDELNEHWFPDASQAGQALARTWADDERWDAHYPAHPLSRLRFEFARLIPTLNFSRDIKNAAPHRG